MEKTHPLKVTLRTETDVLASKYIAGVYMQMMAGILLTALVAYGLVMSGLMEQIAVTGGRGVSMGILILQFGTIMMFRPIMERASPIAMQGLFFFYAAITGVTLGYVGLAYTLTSILNVFGAASFAFGGLAIFGYVTNRNLGVVGTFCLQALWMSFGMSLLYLAGSFFPAFAPYMPALNMMTGLVGVVVFSGLTAYESQTLKQSAYSLAQGRTDERTAAVYTTWGALTMYLNFMNLFFSLLRLFGRRR